MPGAPVPLLGPGRAPIYAVKLLAVREDGFRRMSLGHGRGRGGITEILRPLPVSDLRHILEVLANIVVVALQLLFEEVGGLLGL